MAKNYAQELIKYFKGEQWTNFMNNHLLHENDEVYHAHIYCDSSVHPETMKKVLFNYFEAVGHPLTRRIDPVSPHPGQAGLHSIHPLGLPHFDMYLRGNEKVVFEEMPADAEEAEHGFNALSWGKNYQDDYLREKNYLFKTVGPREEKEIKAFFLGKQWKEMRQYVLDEDICHCHMNVEINFDPKILEIYAREALALMGWTVERVVPCVYDVHGAYTGKLVFLLGQPEEVFDIAWIYDPDVTIRRARKGWVFDLPGFDNFEAGPYAEVLEAANFRQLTEEELAPVYAYFDTLKK